MVLMMAVKKRDLRRPITREENQGLVYATLHRPCGFGGI